MKEFVISDFEKGLVAEQESIRRKLVNKWSQRFKNLNGTEALMLEGASRALGESTISTDVEGYDDFVLKMVRRIYANMIAKELVSVQPIPAPQAKVFYLKPQITTGATQSDWVDMYTSLRENEHWDESKGNYTWNFSFQQSYVTAGPTRPLYGDSALTLTYSGGMIGLPSLCIETSLLPQTELYSAHSSNLVNDSYKDSNLTTVGLYVVGPGTAQYTLDYSGTTSPRRGVLRYAYMGDLDNATNVSPWAFSGSNDGITWTEIISGTSGMTFEKAYSKGVWYDVVWSDDFGGQEAFKYISFSANTDNTLGITGNILIFPSPDEAGLYDTKVHHVLSPTIYGDQFDSGNTLPNTYIYAENDRYSGHGNDISAPFIMTYWKEYDGLEAESTLQQVRLIVNDEDVSALTRKLKTRYSDEMFEDFKALFGDHASDELAALLGDEICAEIDREIIKDLFTIAPFSTDWYYEWNDYSGTTGEIYISGMTKQRIAMDTLLTQINKIDGTIRKANVYHGANWLVCSAKVGSIIEGMPEHEAQVGEVPDRSKIHRTGRLLGRINVYVDPYMPDSWCLLGYNDSNWDAGYIYAPYVVAQSHEVRDPDTLFVRAMGMLSRYGKKIVNNLKYGKVNCTFPNDYEPVNGDTP